jgi:hypothetical protein
MPKKLLNGSDVIAAFQQVSSKRMAKRKLGDVVQ